MGLPAASIKRPVTTLMFYVGVIIFGVIALSLSSQELFPPISYPQLSIVTPYLNAAPEEIETLITRPIEEAVGGISGLRKVTSTSKEGLSLVIAEFGWNQNMDFASLAVREKIDLIKERLPRDAQEPIVIKFNPFELPTLTLSISSSERNSVQLRTLARKYFKDEIEKINGVASASISGGAEEQVLVDVDQAKLRTAGISITEVTGAIAEANLNYPGGTIKENFYEYLVRTIGEFKNINEISQIPVRVENTDPKSKQRNLDPSLSNVPSNRLILLKDVADIQRTIKERTSYSRFNNRENVTVAVQKQAQGNTLKVVNAVKKKLAELKEQLPKDIHVDIISDQSQFIQDALKGVSDAAIQGGVLAFIILLIFLKDLKTSALVVTIIPITVLANYVFMYFMNISLNVISLGGVALGVGMLLDNAVVVVENIHRKCLENPKEGIVKSAIVGTDEVIAPVMGCTLTVVAVFLPIVFVTGIAGQFFKQLAWVVSVTHFLSVIVAYTLLPMLIAKVGGEPPEIKEFHLAVEIPPQKSFLGQVNTKFQKMLEAAYKPIQHLEDSYVKVLPKILDRKGQCLLVVFFLFIASIFILRSLDQVLLPKIDQGQFMIKVDLPVGTRLEFTDKISKKIENFLSHVEDIKTVSVVIGSSRGDATKEIVERLGSHQAQIVVSLKHERKRSTTEVVQEIRQYFELSEGKNLIKPARLSYVLSESAFSVGSENDAPVVIEIKGPKLEGLNELAFTTQQKISKITGVYGVTNTIAEPFPETKLVIDKDRASFYRLSVVGIAQAANVAIKGIVASKLKEEGREIDIRVQLKESDRDQLQKIGSLIIRSPLDLDMPLSDFVKFSRGKGPSEIKRIAQERTVQVFAKIYERNLKEVIADVQAAINSMNIPNYYSVKISGESEEVQESFASLQFAFLLSILLVYMIMAAQFESLWQPFLIMFCVPLSLIGVAFALWMTRTPISVVVVLGIILLGGIVVNNGIILIDFINRLREEGTPLRESVVLAGKIRLRPILITALASAIGLVPLALGIDEGSRLQAPMAIAVIGGLLVATFLTLIVVPALYVGTYEMAFFKRSEKTVPNTETNTSF